MRSSGAHQSCVGFGRRQQRTDQRLLITCRQTNESLPAKHRFRLRARGLNHKGRHTDALHGGDLREKYLIVGRDPRVQTLAARATRARDPFFAGIRFLCFGSWLPGHRGLSHCALLSRRPRSADMVNCTSHVSTNQGIWSRKVAPHPVRGPLARHCSTIISRRAGDRTRTGDVQLGKLAFYQLNYARREARNAPPRFSGGGIGRQLPTRTVPACASARQSARAQAAETGPVLSRAGEGANAPLTATARGTVSTNVVPTPIALSATRSPDMLRARSREIARPSPTPC
jgi:hypothetical protein